MQLESSRSVVGERASPVVVTAVVGAFLACVLALAFLQLRAWNGLVNADGVSYLDLAVQYAHGDLSAVANGYWSPLYPMLLGAALGLARVPTVYLTGTALTPELRAVFVVNTFLLLTTTVLFARLLSVLDARDASEVPLHVRVCRAVACATLWTWCAIRLIGTTTITPDVLLAGWLFLASTELVQASTRPPRRVRAMCLSMALSLGYCTKAVFFPVMLVGGAAYLLSIPTADRRGHLPWLVAPALVIAAPLIVVQSVSQGHLTFGETGRLNYAWYVNDMPHAAPRSELAGVTRARNAGSAAAVRLTSVPNAVLYSGDVSGTFPYWYDPSRFESRSGTRLSLPALARVMSANLHWYKVVMGTFALLCTIAIVAAIARQRVEFGRLLALAPSIALLSLYLLTHPEGRLAGSAIVAALVICLHLAGPRRMSLSKGGTIWAAGELTALTMLVILALGRTSNRVTLQRSRPAAGPVAELAQLATQSGMRVAVIGSPYGQYWAHQSGVHITAVREGDALDATPGREELEAMASESCARGAPLAAILWKGRRPDDSGDQTLASINDWVVWKVASTCNHTDRPVWTTRR